MHRAAKTNASVSISLLIAAGGDVNALDTGLLCPVEVAASANSTDALVALVDAGAMLGSLARGKTSALCRAAARGNAKAVKALLRAGAGVGSPGEVPTALGLAATVAKSAECVRLLLDSGSPFEAGDGSPGTVLNTVLSRSPPAIDVLEVLLAETPCAVDRDAFGRSPLHIAVLSNQPPSLLLTLIAAGAHKDAVDDDGNTPLILAATGPHVHDPAQREELIDFLIAHGADVTIANHKGHTAMMHAVDTLQEDTVRALLLAGTTHDGIREYAIDLSAAVPRPRRHCGDNCDGRKHDVFTLPWGTSVNEGVLISRPNNTAVSVLEERCVAALKEPAESVGRKSRLRILHWIWTANPQRLAVEASAPL